MTKYVKMNGRTLETARKEIEALGFSARIEDRYDTGYLALYVSAENGDDAADYYGEFRGVCPWINSKLEKLAERRGWYCEWENAGEIALAW